MTSLSLLDRYRHYLIQAIAALLSGWLMTLSLPPYNASGTIWVALVPIVLANFLIPPSPPGFPLFSSHQLSSGAMGFWMGLLFFGTTLWWVGHVTVVGACALILYLALYFAVWNRLHHFWTKGFLELNENSSHERSAISLGYIKIATLSSSTWVILEWTRSWMLGGFPWNGLATSQHRVIPILQWASIGGTLLISWWIVFVNVIIALAIRRFHHDIRSGRGYRRYLDLYLMLVAFMGIHLWGFYQVKATADDSLKTLRYASIQPNVPQNEKYESMNGMQILMQHMKLTLESIQGFNPQLVLWPETVCGKVYKTDFDLRACVERVQKMGSFDFIIGTLDIDEDKTFNSALWFPPIGSAIHGGIYHKQHILPFGEYTPFWDTFPYLGRWIPMTRGFDSGEKSALFSLQRSQVKVTPIICFEDTLSSIVRRANDQQPEVLINLTNDAWFKDSPGAAQHLANAVFRTVEFDLPMIRCTNTGITCQINQKGIVEKIFQDEHGNSLEIEGALKGDLQWTKSKVTPYEKWGDWILILSGLFLLLGFRKIKKRPSQESTNAGI